MKINFAKLSSIKIGSHIDVKVVNQDNYNNEIIIGRATNSLVCNGNIGILDDIYDFIELNDDILKVGAKTKNSKLYNFARKHNIGGFEFLSKLPGSIGGSIKMNAGMKSYEISNNLISINSIPKNEFSFEYRNTNIDIPIFYAEFKISREFNHSLLKEFMLMRQNQPKLPSLGSAFKNPKGDYAGRLIESVGLKGEKFGDVGFSQLHANFLVNYGKGSCDDVLNALDQAKKRVFNQFGINLQEEIKIYL